MNKTMFVIGLSIVCLSAALLLLDQVESGVSAAIGMLGIGLIAASGRRKRVRAEPAPAAQNVQTIHSPDGHMRAQVWRRADGKYQVEFHHFIRGESQDFGPDDRWVRQSDAPLTDTLASAIELASLRVGAGTGDFFEEEV